MRPRRNIFNRSAELHSAVSPICNRQTVRTAGRFFCEKEMRPARCVLKSLRAIVCLVAFSSFGQEPTEWNTASGIWRWTFTMPDGSKVQPRAKLQQRGDKLTGTSKIRDGLEAVISDGRVSSDELSFAVIRQRDGVRITTLYKGIRHGDQIQGTIESNWNGQKQTYAWEARRFSRDPTGTWEWRLANRWGRTNEMKLTLTHEEGTLAGTFTAFGQEIEIDEGKTGKEGDISFKIVREINEDIVTSSYNGKVLGDIIRGKVEVTGGDRDRTYFWEAKRTD